MKFYKYFMEKSCIIKIIIKNRQKGDFYMRTILNVNRKWAFSKEADHIPEAMPENWYWVNLPHTWNTIDGQDGGNDYYRGTCYYAKELLKSELPEGKQYFLEILGANASADV